MGLPGAGIGGGSRACSTSGLWRPASTACNMPTLGPHQATRTAFQPRALNILLKEFGAYSHLQLAAVHLDVAALSCTVLKVAMCPCSFQAITSPRLLRFASSLYQRVPHPPSCHEKS